MSKSSTAVTRLIHSGLLLNPDDHDLLGSDSGTGRELFVWSQPQKAECPLRR
jgi:hypothetical protein